MFESRFAWSRPLLTTDNDDDERNRHGADKAHH